MSYEVLAKDVYPKNGRNITHVKDHYVIALAKPYYLVHLLSVRSSKNTTTTNAIT